MMEIKDPSRPELPTLQVLDVLRDCLKEATVQLSAENSVTISLVIPLIQGVANDLKTTKEPFTLHGMSNNTTRRGTSLV